MVMWSACSCLRTPAAARLQSTTAERLPWTLLKLLATRQQTVQWLREEFVEKERRALVAEAELMAMLDSESATTNRSSVRQGEQAQRRRKSGGGNSSEFCCPITSECMRDPVMVTATGMTYEREAIAKWLSEHDIDPSTGVELGGNKLLAPNVSIRKMIDAWSHGCLASESDS